MIPALVFHETREVLHALRRLHPARVLHGMTIFDKIGTFELALLTRGTKFYWVHGLRDVDISGDRGDVQIIELSDLVGDDIFYVTVNRSGEILLETELVALELFSFSDSDSEDKRVLTPELVEWISEDRLPLEFLGAEFTLLQSARFAVDEREYYSWKKHTFLSRDGDRLVLHERVKKKSPISVHCVREVAFAPEQFSLFYA